jgi:hypothetical protein
MINVSLVVGENENEFDPEKFNHNKNVFELLDKTKKPLFWAQLCYDNNIFYIETDYLSVLDFNPEMKYIKVELDEKTKNLFENIDDRGIVILKNLLSSDELSDLFDEIDSNINHSTLTKLDSNTNKYYTKIRLDDKIKINLNKKKINMTDLNNLKFTSEDKIRLLLEINSLNLYKNDNICGIKFFCHNIEITTPIDVSQFKRPVNNNYKFTPSKVNNIIVEDLECDYGATEVSPRESNKSSKLTINTKETFNNIEETFNNTEDIMNNIEDIISNIEEKINNNEETVNNNEETINNNEETINNTEEIMNNTEETLNKNDIFISTNKKAKSKAAVKSKITTETITTKPTTKPNTISRKKAPVKTKN